MTVPKRRRVACVAERIEAGLPVLGFFVALG
jgi:hypothetical protein